MPTESTHTVCALLDDPLFALGGKRVGKLFNSFFSSVSRTASDENRQNMVDCALGGALANLAEARA